ncbi:hypothetical protein HMPREF0645_1031 [Hallella bergensis DSM 17361]|uniref:Uncharacterized protein n=1 Tax=Hallella bergensis DSM 17361 TaxID=585502 RepID=D1PVP6_9BACT|nr:hypothetical protein HMPREF0645_1031 [Hallella bergensis DSM 17361]
MINLRHLVGFIPDKYAIKDIFESCILFIDFQMAQGKSGKHKIIGVGK